MSRKGRSALQRHPGLTVGARNPSAKITEDDVKDIRAASVGNGKLQELATRYGMTVDGIYKIRSRQSWRHVN